MKSILAILTTLVGFSASATNWKLYTCSTPQQDKLIRIYRTATGSSADLVKKIAITSRNENGEANVTVYQPLGNATQRWVTFMDGDTKMGITLEDVELSGKMGWMLVGLIGKATQPNLVHLEDKRPLVCSFEIAQIDE